MIILQAIVKLLIIEIPAELGLIFYDCHPFGGCQGFIFGGCQGSVFDDKSISHYCTNTNGYLSMYANSPTINTEMTVYRYGWLNTPTNLICVSYRHCDQIGSGFYSNLHLNKLGSTTRQILIDMQTQPHIEKQYDIADPKTFETHKQMLSEMRKINEYLKHCIEVEDPA